MSVHDTSFAVYFADHDAVIECGACDPEYGDPAEWPSWVDADRWEPSEADSVWAAENLELPPPIAGGAPELESFEPSDADWDDMHAARYGFGDDDIQAAGLPVG